MKLYHFEDANEFYECIKPELIQNEGYYNLHLAIVEQLKHYPNLTQSPYLVTVQENNQFIAVAMITKPGKLILSRVLNFEAIAIIAQDLHTRQELIASVLGPVDEAQAFAETWQTILPISLTAKVCNTWYLSTRKCGVAEHRDELPP